MFWNKYELLCKKIGKSPNAFAKEIGAGTSACTYWKNGAIPKGETLLRIADNFNCSIDYLLGRTENPQSHTGGYDKLSDKEQRCLNAFNNLLPDDKIEFLARMEQRYEDYSAENKESV